MSNFTVQQRIKVIETYYENSRSVKTTFRKLRSEFGQYDRPTEKGILQIVQKFQTTGTVCDLRHVPHSRPVRSTENIEAVRESVAENPSTSTRRRSQQVNISDRSLRRILHDDLDMHAYKVQVTQELLPDDHAKRREFADWMLGQFSDDNRFYEKIIFSDESHFHLNGFVNKQNCRIWATENPRAYQEVSSYPQRVSVWCGFWSQGVIGPYFFEKPDGKAANVDGANYRKMIDEFLWPILDGMDISEMWFQQDGAKCHTAAESRELLKTRFADRFISLGDNIEFPPRSCDLTPLDFFLWGYVKEKVYANNPTTIPELKNEIRRIIGEIQPHLCQNVIRNLNKRILHCKKSRGGHLPDIIFHV